MGITITIASNVPEADFAQIQALARHVQGHDGNFRDRAISVERGLLTGVTDPEDDLRAALLGLMVVGVLTRGPAQT